MCLIAFAWGVHPDYPLVIAANRDEAYARPTAPLAQWTTPAGHAIIGGRDLKDGGTWMGFTPSGRFAMLTNVRNPHAVLPASARSRGHLVVDWLGSELSASQWCAQRDMQSYAGFNLILGDWAQQQCHYVSNQTVNHNLPNPTEALLLKFGNIYGLSNAALDTPWPKTQWLVGHVKRSLSAPDVLAAPVALEHLLLGGLQRSELAPTAELPQTGVDHDLESALSSVFVRYPLDAPTYGTRSSLCAVASHDGLLRLTETTYGEPEHTIRRSLNWAR
jgi:uncharacterized protein with NRDE domain